VPQLVDDRPERARGALGLGDVHRLTRVPEERPARASLRGVVTAATARTKSPRPACPWRGASATWA
jgi:hypothetical protein